MNKEKEWTEKLESLYSKQEQKILKYEKEILELRELVNKEDITHKDHIISMDKLKYYEDLRNWQRTLMQGINLARLEIIE